MDAGVGSAVAGAASPAPAIKLFLGYAEESQDVACIAEIGGPRLGL